MEAGERKVSVSVSISKILFTTAWEIGSETGIVKKSPVHCPGTRFY
jgi:hypothetical protein